jgi:cytoskeleton protein RodZ
MTIDPKIEPQSTEPLPTEDYSGSAPQLFLLEPAQSAGSLMRAARNAQGIDLSALSHALKVPVKKLEALEADDWATLPDPVFVRALATSFSRHVKTDSRPILALLPPIRSPIVLDDAAAAGLNQRFIGARDVKPSLFRMQVSIPMLLGTLILLLAAVIILFLPDFAQHQQSNKTESVEFVAPVADPVLKQPIETPSPAPSVDATTATIPASAVSPTVVSAAPAPAPAPVAVPAAPPLPPVAGPPQAQLVVSGLAPSSASTTPPPTLRLVAKGIVWVEVKDSKGTVLVQRNLQPKEVVNAFGSSPLSVVVGRINEIEAIDVRGKPFSLAGMSPDNVARFEVK